MINSFLVSASEHAPLLTLFAMLLAAAFVTLKAMRTEGFDASQMLRDGDGKPSALRLAILVALGVSSWVVMRDGLRPSGADPIVLLIYCGTWSASPVAAKAIEAWSKKVVVK